MFITHHAIDRFLERIDPTLTRDQAEARIRTAERGVTAAANFGCRTVIMGCGARLRLEGDRVVTVVAARGRL